MAGVAPSARASGCTDLGTVPLAPTTVAGVGAVESVCFTFDASSGPVAVTGLDSPVWEVLPNGTAALASGSGS